MRFGLLLSLALAATLGGCSGLEKRYVDIPEGYAAQTLKEFAKQARVEIVFNAPSVAGVVTNPVEGSMTPQAALDTMLSGTDLYFEIDTETGAYAVTHIRISDASMRYRIDVSNLGYIEENTKKLKFF